MYLFICKQFIYIYNLSQFSEMSTISQSYLFLRNASHKMLVDYFFF